ncbi:hypothetical protein F5148DRAFT_1150846 [Russula earlei]|uniref:Uncharacterized protein n=1 Tax=Russula earlei TaxID=71964 RepID=A0ACC0U3Y5_9AGAM|nr:hypothetical protein F5148DRAFT_1150846 [Russula earlei]
MRRTGTSIAGVGGLLIGLVPDPLARSCRLVTVTWDAETVWGLMKGCGVEWSCLEVGLDWRVANRPVNLTGPIVVRIAVAVGLRALSQNIVSNGCWCAAPGLDDNTFFQDDE